MKQTENKGLAATRKKMKIQIIRAKPNPAGKDKVKSVPQADHLLGEWVDIRNDESKAIDQGNLSLSDMEFNKEGEPREAIYWNGIPGVMLEGGATLRIHTGRSSDQAKMLPIDAQGVDVHAFAGHGNFVLNNAEGDVVRLYYKGVPHAIDKAGYDANPKEGAILIRKGDKLVEAGGGSHSGGTSSGSGWSAPAVIGHSGKAA